MLLINDNINKVPRDLTEVGPEQKQFRSSVRLFGRVAPSSIAQPLDNYQFNPINTATNIALPDTVATILPLDLRAALVAHGPLDPLDSLDQRVQLDQPAATVPLAQRHPLASVDALAQHVPLAPLQRTDPSVTPAPPDTLAPLSSP